MQRQNYVSDQAPSRLGHAPLCAELPPALYFTSNHRMSAQLVPTALLVSFLSQADSGSASQLDGRGKTSIGQRASPDHRMDVGVTRRSGPHPFDIFSRAGLDMSLVAGLSRSPGLCGGNGTACVQATMTECVSTRICLSGARTSWFQIKA